MKNYLATLRMISLEVSNPRLAQRHSLGGKILEACCTRGGLTHVLSAPVLWAPVLLALTLMTTGLLHAPLATAQNHSSLPQTITVTGMGEASLRPDRAALSVYYESQGQTVAAVKAQVDQAVAKTLEALADLDAVSKPLQATHLTISPHYDWDPDQKKQRQRGFNASRQIDITLQDLASLAAVLETLAALSPTRITPPQLSASDAHAARDQALERALSDATQQATVLASAAKRPLGRILAITDQPLQDTPRPPVMRALAADAADASYTAESLRVQRTLTVVFALE